MFKINSYCLFFLTALFLNNANMLRSSSMQSIQHPEIINSSQSISQPSNNITSKPHQWHFNNSNYIPPPFMSSGWHPNNATNISNTNNASFSTTYDSISSNTPNNSTNTEALFPLDCSGTPPSYNYPFNSSTNTFISPFMFSGWNLNSSTNTLLNIDNAPFAITHDSISSDMINNSVNTNNCTTLPIPDEQVPSSTIDTSASTKERMDHVPTNKKKVKKKKKKVTKNYTCGICNKKLASINSLNYHVKTHNPNRPRPYKCNICTESFTEKSILKSHLKSHTDEKPFKCDYCKAYFKTKNERTRHHHIHTDKKPHKCNFCKKTFTFKHNLKTHIRTHTGEKPFKCDLCQKRFSSKQELTIHLNWHKGIKPYQCEICNETFGRKKSLKEHVKLHKDKRPYKCTLCPKTYKTKDGLKYHTKTHNRPKPYICTYCSDAFAHKSTYDDHMRYEESKDEDCKCHRCKKVYSNTYNLQQHNKRIHEKNNRSQ